MLVEERDERRKPVANPPPDGGWGWMVVFASFMIHVIADGVAYSFGLFFVEISRDLEGSKSAASWIGSILLGVTFGAGPIASAFVNRYGCRAVSIAGSFVASFGFGISYWATSLVYLYISVGVIGGLGLGLIYLPAIVCVSCYFEKKRAFATGIAVCGSGFGNFCLAPVFNILIHRLGWRASLVAVAMVLLLCIIFAAMFRPVPDQPDEYYQRNPNYELDSVKGLSMAGKNDNYFLTASGEVRNCREGSPVDTAGGAGCDGIELMPVKYLRDEKSDSTSTLRRVDSLEEIALKTDSIVSDTHSSRLLPEQNKGIITSKKDIFLFGSSSQIPDLIPEDKFDSESQARNDRPSRLNSKSTCCGGRFNVFSPEFISAIQSMMDFALLSNPVFIYFAFSNFLTNVGFNVPYVYLADMAKDNLKVQDGDHSLGFIVGSIGIANTVSRFVLGYLSDKKWVNRLYLYSTSLTLCGIATGISAHGMNVEALVFCAGLFGATGGVYVGLTSVILVDLLGLDKLSNSFGIVLLFQGVGTIIGPPIVGAIFDQFHSYIYGFWLAGIMIAISGSMLFLIPCIQRRQDGNERLRDRNTPYFISSENPHHHGTSSLLS